MPMSDWKNVQYKDGKYRTSDEGGGGASALTDLTDVNVSSPSDGQVLKYDSTTQKWKNENESGGGSVNDVTLDGNSVVNGQGTAVLTTPNVNDLKDTNISNPSNGQTLQYNASAQKWENATPASGGNVDDVKVNGVSVVDANKEAQITSYKELTLAEYQALPSSKLSDDVMYCIKDVGGANQFPPLIYSKEEREIGVWIDGKPLYQRVLQFNPSISLNSDSWYLALTDSTIIPIESRALKMSQYGGYPIAADCDAGDGVYIKSYESINGIDAIILVYTKTTDTPGSGTWNQQGGYAHHYSTSEKVIGTWINGKPIYERVIDFTEFQGSTNQWITTPVNIPNGEYVVSCGFAQHPSLSSNFLYWVFCRFDSSGNLQAWFNGSTYYYARCKIQYTKSTD